jgi:hypothetical protein
MFCQMTKMMDILEAKIRKSQYILTLLSDFIE